MNRICLKGCFCHFPQVPKIQLLCNSLHVEKPVTSASPKTILGMWWASKTRFLTHTWFSSVQSHSRVWLLATPWSAARRASLSNTNSRILLKLMSIESMTPSHHLNLCCSLLLPPSIFPSIRMVSNESVFASGGQSIGAPASASVLSMNIQDWFL